MLRTGCASALPSATMDTSLRTSARPVRDALVAALTAVALLAAVPSPASADAPGADDDAAVVLMAAEERERRPIAPTQRDQLGLVLYGLMGLATVAGIATLRRQLKGERPQTDGEFRWR